MFAKQSGFQPQALLNRPKPEPEYEFYRVAYYRLSRSRLWFEGLPQAISLTEIATYCSFTGVRDQGLRENLVDLVQAMDGVFIDHMAEQQAASRAKSDVVPK
jgi:hypothetical protein